MIVTNKTRQGQLFETVRNGCVRVMPYGVFEVDDDNITSWELDRMAQFFSIEKTKPKRVKEMPVYKKEEQVEEVL